MTQTLLNPANNTLIVYNDTNNYNGDGLYLLYKDGEIVPEKIQSIGGKLLTDKSKPITGQIIGHAIAMIKFFAPPTDFISIIQENKY